MIASWQVPFQLSTPQGTLDLNSEVAFATGSGRYLLLPRQCKVQIPLRATDDDIPQQSGEQLHRRFFKGMLMTLSISLWQTTEQPACDELLQEMLDDLIRHYRAIANASDARVYWTPQGAAQRMMKAVDLEEQYDLSIEDDAGLTVVTFQLKSPYPYAWTAAETTTALNATLTNSGTAEFWPVIKVYGPTSTFTIENADALDDQGQPLQLVYDGSAIGGASYAEINMFEGTIYLNGDSTNLLDGMDMESSDFFPIVVGANDITITGATADVLWQNAWG